MKSWLKQNFKSLLFFIIVALFLLMSGLLLITSSFLNTKANETQTITLDGNGGYIGDNIIIKNINEADTETGIASGEETYNARYNYNQYLEYGEIQFSYRQYSYDSSHSLGWATTSIQQGQLFGNIHILLELTAIDASQSSKNMPKEWFDEGKISITILRGSGKSIHLNSDYYNETTGIYEQYLNTEDYYSVFQIHVESYFNDSDVCFDNDVSTNHFHMKGIISSYYESDQNALVISDKWSHYVPHGVRYGYEFMGYDRDAEWQEGKTVDFYQYWSIYEVDSSITKFYAQWKLGEYELILKDPSGENGNQYVKAVFTQSLPSQNIYGSPLEIPVRSGYKFLGYATEDGTYYYNDKLESIKNWDREDETLYAQWVPIITIYYHYEIYSTNIDEYDTVVVNYGGALPAQNEVVQAGYLFLGYYNRQPNEATSQGRGTIYYSPDKGGSTKLIAEVVSVTEYDANNELHLYAHWKESWAVSEYVCEPLYGDGNSWETAYQISTANQLAWIANRSEWGNPFNNKYFIQTADIDLSAHEWIPIGNKRDSFNGNYDGNGFSIKNMKLVLDDDSYTAPTYAGLFGNVANSIIKNVIIESGEVYGNCFNAGGIVGKATASQILNCINYAERNGLSTNGSGGIAGAVESCYVNDCINMGMVNSYNYVGGIVGYANEVDVINCKNMAKVWGASEGVGGIIGRAETVATITSCLNMAEVEANSNTGGILGVSAGETTITKCYAACSITSSDVHGGIVGRLNGGTKTTITSSMFNGIISKLGTEYALIAGSVATGSTVSIKDCLARNNDAQNSSTSSIAFGGGEILIESTLCETNCNKYYYIGDWSNWGYNNGKPVPKGICWIAVGSEPVSGADIAKNYTIVESGLERSLTSGDVVIQTSSNGVMKINGTTSSTAKDYAFSKKILTRDWSIGDKIYVSYTLLSGSESIVCSSSHELSFQIGVARESDPSYKWDEWKTYSPLSKSHREKFLNGETITFSITLTKEHIASPFYIWFTSEKVRVTQFINAEIQIDLWCEYV